MQQLIRVRARYTLDAVRHGWREFRSASSFQNSPDGLRSEPAVTVPVIPESATWLELACEGVRKR